MPKYRAMVASLRSLLIVPGAHFCWHGWQLTGPGSKIAEGEAVINLFADQHPWQSLSLLYACNTGVFLFLEWYHSRLYVQNKIQYSRIAERMVRHPVLVSFSGERLRKIALNILDRTLVPLLAMWRVSSEGMSSGIQRYSGYLLISVTSPFRPVM